MSKFALILLLLSMVPMAVIVCVSPFVTSPSVVSQISSLYCLASGLSFVAMILDHRKGGISYTFEFFMLFFIAVPSRVQISLNIFPFAARLDPADMSGAYGIIALSHLAYHAAWLWKQRRSGAPIQRDQGHLEQRDALFYMKWAWGFAALSLLFAGIAGPQNLFIARFDRPDVEFGGFTQQFLYMARSLSLLALVMMLYLHKNMKRSRLWKQNLQVTIIFFCAFWVINFLPALPRFILFGIFIAISALTINYFDRFNKAVVAVASVFLLFVLFPVVKSLGYGEINWSGFSSRMSFESIMAYILRVDFDGFMQIASTIQYLTDDIGPIRYGNNFLGVILFFVPRAVWPGKPVHTGEIVSSGLGYIYHNVSSPLPAEAAMAFGYLGPVLVFILLGAFVAATERGVRPSRSLIPSPSSVFVYAITMGFLMIVMRGALNAVASQFSTAFLAFLLMEACRRRSIVFRKKYSPLTPASPRPDMVRKTSPHD